VTSNPPPSLSRVSVHSHAHEAARAGLATCSRIAAMTKGRWRRCHGNSNFCRRRRHMRATTRRLFHYQAQHQRVVFRWWHVVYNGMAHRGPCSHRWRGGSVDSLPVFTTGACSAEKKKKTKKKKKKKTPTNVPDTPCTASYRFAGDANHPADWVASITITKADQTITWNVPARWIRASLSGNQLDGHWCWVAWRPPLDCARH